MTSIDTRQYCYLSPIASLGVFGICFYLNIQIKIPEPSFFSFFLPFSLLVSFISYLICLCLSFCLSLFLHPATRNNHSKNTINMKKKKLYLFLSINSYGITEKLWILGHFILQTQTRPWNSILFPLHVDICLCILCSFTKDFNCQALTCSKLQVVFHLMKTAFLTSSKGK